MSTHYENRPIGSDKGSGEYSRMVGAMKHDTL